MSSIVQDDYDLPTIGCIFRQSSLNMNSSKETNQNELFIGVNYYL